MNDAKNVQLLSLILVYSLDLDIKKCFGVDFNTGGIQNVLCKSYLIGEFDFLPLLFEFLVVGVVFELVQQCQVVQIFVAPKLGCDEFRQARVCLMQPSSRGDTVSHVGELIGAIDPDKVPENCCLDQVRVKFGYTIDFMAPDDCQVSHPYHLRLRFLNDGNCSKYIPSKLLLHHLKKSQVDLINDLEMSRK